MTTRIRNRVIRPSSRKESSAYRVKCENVGLKDVLQINISHESLPQINYTYEIQGEELKGKNSIHFDATSDGEVTWKDGVKPKRIY
ncbi:hypothetical protein ASZ90_004534 [hydrocarbon metagenome]|uniref:Uncharacterized protein n=1 Tax=hydrocarbon metagenome TaxID=938273 RepID=A0A0W8FXR7_9ZZZZ